MLMHLSIYSNASVVAFERALVSGGIASSACGIAPLGGVDATRVPTVVFDRTGDAKGVPAWSPPV